MSDFDFAAWIEASRKATKGPWVTRYDCDYYVSGFYLHSGRYDVCRFQEDEDDPNIAFIAQSRMAPDAVLELVRKARIIIAGAKMYAKDSRTIKGVWPAMVDEFMTSTAWAKMSEDDG